MNEMTDEHGFLQELRRGWRAGLGATLGMATGTSLFLLTSGFFVRPLGEAFHWSRGQIALGAFGSLLGAVATPAAGWLSDRYGPRLVGAAGLAAVAVVFAGLSTLTGDIRVFYGWLVALHILGAASSAIVLSRPIAQAFDTYRGAALGLGLGLSALIVTAIMPLVASLIASQGWRIAYLVLAGAPGLLGLGAVLLFVPPHRRLAVVPKTGEGHASLAGALRDRRFWLIFVAMLAANLAFGGILGQLPAMLADRGVSAVGVGLAMSLLTASTVVGRLTNGVLMDRLWAPAVAGGTLLIPIGGLMLLLAPHAELGRAVAAVILLGLAQGGEATILSFFIARYFGFRAYGAIYGALAVAISFSLAGGGAMFGMVYDRTHAYDVALFVAAGGLALAAASLIGAGLDPRPADVDT
jgi:MFS family permease